MPRPKAARAEHRPFDPADFSAYRFEPDGTPVRIRPATRGKWAGWTGPISCYVRINHTGHPAEMFGITRDDGTQRSYSRQTILRALGQPPAAPLDPEDPWSGPPGNHFPRRSIEGFPDYVADARGRVWRFQSPGRGQYARPLEISIVAPGHRRYRDGRSREGYFTLDSVTGHRRSVSRAQVLDLAGWSDDERKMARILEISLSGD